MSAPAESFTIHVGGSSMHEHDMVAGHLGPVATALLQTPAIDATTARAAPGDVFRHPRDVTRHPGLSLSEKRAILAAWASDAHAVEACPTLRCLPGCRAEVVAIDEVLAALQALDTDRAAHPASVPPAYSRRPLGRQPMPERSARTRRGLH